MISYKNIYSLGQAGGDIVGDFHNFKRVHRSGFNITDSPDIRFFKLLFYFYNDDDDDNTRVDFFNGGSSGLLAPTWLDTETDKNYFKYNSAWAYLKSNYEEERADALKEFVTLLSQISSESPWYFKEIGGVDEALTRENWKVGEERKKISIKCMNDPIDHRIESLLSLYRSIVWSHTRKCQVLPANLRKFDMGLFVFSGLTTGLNFGYNELHQQDNWTEIGGTSIDKAINQSTYKYIEFHNCEISIDSLKSGYAGVSNENGFEQEFTIDIYFDDCYENEYNPFIMKLFGDFFVWDSWTINGRDDEGNYVGELVKRDLEWVESDASDFNGGIDYTIGRDTLTNIDEVNGINSSATKGALLTDLNSRLNYFSNDQNSINQFKLDKTTKWVDVKNQFASALNRMGESAKHAAVASWNNAIKGGLGNIYGQGVGLQGVLESTTSELNKQFNSLTNKISGNINDTTTKISKSLTATVTNPITGAVESVTKGAGNLVDAATNIVGKPILGSLKAAETAAERVSELGYSYIDEAGQYVSNKADDLGSLAYDKQAIATNNIGKNRLNAKLGNLN